MNKPLSRRTFLAALTIPAIPLQSELDRFKRAAVQYMKREQSLRRIDIVSAYPQEVIYADADSVFTRQVDADERAVLMAKFHLDAYGKHPVPGQFVTRIVNGKIHDIAFYGYKIDS